MTLLVSIVAMLSLEIAIIGALLEGVHISVLTSKRKLLAKRVAEKLKGDAIRTFGRERSVRVDDRNAPSYPVGYIFEDHTRRQWEVKEVTRLNEKESQLRLVDVTDDVFELP